MRSWSNCRAFFAQFRQQYQTTGSILPSSRGLARALTRPMRRAKGPRRILEVGPGTGAVTDEILRNLKEDDRLDIVEINAAFVAHLERRFQEEPLWRRRRPMTRILHMPLQQAPGRGTYDFLISGLPLNNFALSLVDDIFQAYQRLTRRGGWLSYFEYAAIRTVKRLFVGPAEKQRLGDIGRYLEEKIERYQAAEDWVWLNVPPAIARHLRF